MYPICEEYELSVQSRKTPNRAVVRIDHKNADTPDQPDRRTVGKLDNCPHLEIPSFL